MADRTLTTSELEAAIAAHAAACDAGDSLAPDLALLGAQGWRTAPLPVEAGGRGWAHGAAGVPPLLQALRLLGRANLSVARLFEGHVNAIKLVQLYGTAEQQAEIAEAVTDGAWLGVWGADGAPPVTLHDQTLAGVKAFASGLGLIERAVVSVNTPAGAQLTLARVDDPARADPSSWRVCGMRATLSGTYRFDGVEVQLLGQPGDYGREPWFEGGVWRYCAAHLGGAEALRDLAMAHLRARSGLVDGDADALRRVGQLATLCETARLWITEAGHKTETAGGAGKGEGAAGYALLARAVTEDCCTQVMTVTERVLGTAGHREGHAADRVRRDLSLFLRQADLDGKARRAATALLATDGRADQL